MIALITLASIAALFILGTIARQQYPSARRFIPCAFCGSVVLTWAWMLIGRWVGLPLLQGTNALLILGIIMGGSAVGFPTRLAGQWKTRGVRGADLAKAIMILLGFMVAYAVLAGRWGWLIFTAIAGIVIALFVIPAIRAPGNGSSARASFLERINHCCDE